MIIELPGEQVDVDRNIMYKCTGVYITDSLTIVRINKNKWGAISKYDYSSLRLSGVLNGYNSSAEEVAYALYKLGFWSQEEMQKFKYQQRETWKAMIRENEIEKSYHTLKTYGITVPKIIKGMEQA